MQKELMMVLLILLLPAFVIVSVIELQNPAGQIVNDIEKLRLERIKQMTFPKTGVGLSYDCKQEVNMIRDLLRLNSDHRYYDYLGLRGGQLFFENEKELFSRLIGLVHLRKIGENMYAGITDAPVVVTEYDSIVNYGRQNVCSEEIALQAAEELALLSDWNSRLILKTIDMSNCPNKQEAYLTHGRAMQAYSTGNYDLFLNDLYNAWWQATECNEVLQY
ncbi:MAG TPA: hypothetical protein VI612_03365 [Candidatus Nanoarchaeia archaeon]|nr:hypothetical protein [Candidatus Nanoarchaeia archaeon]